MTTNHLGGWGGGGGWWNAADVFLSVLCSQKEDDHMLTNEKAFMLKMFTLEGETKKICELKRENLHSSVQKQQLDMSFRSREEPSHPHSESGEQLRNF